MLLRKRMTRYLIYHKIGGINFKLSKSSPEEKGMVEEKEKTLHLSQGEIVALKKAIMYLKFSCEETESLMYAGSPLINSAFSKIIEVDDLGWAAKEFYSKRHEINEEFISRKLTMMEKENGRPHDDAIMEQVFSECLYPFVKK